MEAAATLTTCTGRWAAPQYHLNVPSEHKTYAWSYDATTQHCDGCADVLVIAHDDDGLRTRTASYVVTNALGSFRSLATVAAFGVANMEAAGAL